MANFHMFANMAGVMDAAVPRRLLSAGQYVECSGRTCFIQSVMNTLVFNQYHIVDIDTGVMMKKPSYELTLIPREVVAHYEADNIV